MSIHNSLWRWTDMKDQRRNLKAPLEQVMEGWLLWGNFSPKTLTWYREVFLHFVRWVQEDGGEGLL